MHFFYFLKQRISLKLYALFFLLVFLLPHFSSAQCFTGIKFPTPNFTPACSGGDEVITTGAFAGEYTVVNVTAGNTYTFKSSVATDFVTIATNVVTPVAITFGTAPLTWTATSTTSIRFYLHLNSTCGTQNTNRTRSLICASCIAPTGLTATGVTSTGATITWGLPVGAPTGYQWEVRSSGAPGSGSTGLGASGSAAPQFVLGAVVSGLNPGTTYSVYVRTDCGGGNFSAWTSAYVFSTTCPAPTNITSSSITSTGATISWTAPATGSPVGYQWEARTSGAGGSGNTGLAVSGITTAPTTSQVITTLSSGVTYSIYVRSDCGGGFSTWTGPISFTTLLTCYPPTALAASGMTVNSANISWAAPALGTPAGYVWELRTAGAGGSGATGLAVTGATTAPTTSASVAGLAEGTAFSLYVRTNCTGTDGSSTWAGPFIVRTLHINDLCSGAITVACGSTIASNTIGATNDAIVDQCGASNTAGQAQTAPGTWYKYVGDDKLVTASLCGSSYDTRISVLEGSCGSLICVSGNDDYSPCGTSSQTTFTAFAGHDYYILIHGFGVSSGNFNLAITCATLCTPVTSNDNCAGAETLAVQIGTGTVYTNGNNICATVGPIINPAGCGSAFGSLVDVFYTFNTGTTTATYIDMSNVGVVLPAAAGTYYYALYRGDCITPIYVSCGTLTINTPVLVSNLLPSTQYFLRIYFVDGIGTRGNYLIKLEAPYIWTGATDTNWGDASNWIGGIPNSNVANVVIPNVTNKPIVPKFTTYAIKNAQIAVGSGLTVVGTLQIAGAISRAGAFNVASGTLEYNGTAAQSIAANTFSTTIRNFIANNINGITLLGAITVTGNYTPTAGVLASNGFLTIASTIITTARVGQGSTAGGYITGNVNTQRYIPSGYRKFRFLSHPMSTAIPLSQFTDDIDITGTITGTNANAFTTTASNAPSSFYFNEAIDNGLYVTGNNAGWVPFTSASVASTIAKAQGVRLLVRGSKGQAGTLNGAGALPAEVTVDFLGTLTQGNFNLPLAYSSANTFKGWNLVGNPYASNINWTSIGRTNVNDAIYTYRPSTGSYASYVNSSSTNGGSNIIESGSGFFVQAISTSAVLTFGEAAKTATDPAETMFRTSNTITDRISLKLKDASVVTDEGDEVIVRFGVDKKATDGFDKLYDAHDLGGAANNLYVLDAAGDNYSIYHGNELKNKLIEKREIPLGVNISKTGTYTIDADVLNEFVDGNNVYLSDKETNTLTLLNNNGSYTFNATVAKDYKDRFSLVFNAKEVSLGVKELVVTPNPATDKIQIVFRNKTTENSVITITDISGRLVKKIDAGKVESTSLNVDVTSFSKGTYFVQLIAGKDRLVTKLVIQ